MYSNLTYMFGTMGSSNVVERLYVDVAARPGVCCPSSEGRPCSKGRTPRGIRIKKIGAATYERVVNGTANVYDSIHIVG